MYDALQVTMAEKGLDPDCLHSLLTFVPEQPCMTDAECCQGMTGQFIEWCANTAPPSKDAFDNV